MLEFKKKRLQTVGENLEVLDGKYKNLKNTNPKTLTTQNLPLNFKKFLVI